MSLSTKKILRQKILQQRQSLNLAQWQKSSNLISDRLRNWSIFQEATTVFAYFSFRQEVDLSSLFYLDKKWGFPRCVDQSLVWHLWQLGDSLSQDRYGIKTPTANAPIMAENAANLILVPTVACDRHGYRLGYGGGFYDRFLSSLKVSNITNIYTVGIVFDFAYLPQLPQDSWDIPLDFICSETQLSCITKS